MSAPQSRWQWALPIMLVMAATGFGAYSAGLLPKPETASVNAWLTKVRASIPALSSGDRPLTPPVLTGSGAEEKAASPEVTVAENEPRLASTDPFMANAGELPALDQQAPEEPPANSEPDAQPTTEPEAPATLPELDATAPTAPEMADLTEAEPDGSEPTARPELEAEPDINETRPREPRRFAAKVDLEEAETDGAQAPETDVVALQDAPRGLGELEEEEMPRRPLSPIDTAPVVDLPAEGDAVPEEPEVVVPKKTLPTKTAARPVRSQNTVKRTKPIPEDAEQPTATAKSKFKRLSPISDIETKEQRALPLREMAEIEKLRSLGDTFAALQELSRWYWRHPEQRAELQEQIDEMADEVFFAPRPHFHAEHVVQPNDRLSTIARKYNVPWEYLARVNRVDPKKVRAGQKLKVVDGPFSAFVSLGNFELIVHLNGVYVHRFPVGIGKAGSSPLGTFAVKEKLVDPTYYGDEGVIAHNDPKNPLGERWIDIGDSFGIHGTIEPDSIGKAESKGCIRLANGDVDQVYDLLSIGSQVTIHR